MSINILHSLFCPLKVCQFIDHIHMATEIRLVKFTIKLSYWINWNIYKLPKYIKNMETDSAKA
jgi:hypothetical protein